MLYLVGPQRTNYGYGYGSPWFPDPTMCLAGVVFVIVSFSAAKSAGGLHMSRHHHPQHHIGQDTHPLAVRTLGSGNNVAAMVYCMSDDGLEIM